MDIEPETLSTGASLLALQHLMTLMLADVTRAVPNGRVARLVNNPALWDVQRLAITHPVLEDAVWQDVAAMLGAANRTLTSPTTA